MSFNKINLTQYLSANYKNVAKTRKWLWNGTIAQETWTAFSGPKVGWTKHFL